MSDRDAHHAAGQPRPSLPGEEWAWLLAAALAPLAFNSFGCSPFELPKAALVQACALAAVLFALLAPSASKRAGRTPLLWPLLAVGAATLLATLASINRGASLWGSFERQQGLLTVAAYLALAGVVGARLVAWPQARRLLRVLVGASAPVVIYALAQALGRDPVPWQTDAASPVISTIGRANFLGSYLVLLIPLTAVAARLAARRWPYWLLLAGQVIALAVTQARAAWLGAAVGISALLILWASAERRRPLAYVGLGVAGGLLLAILALNLAPALPSALERVPGLARLASLTDTGSGSTAARLTIWRAGAALVADRPLLGYGPETTDLAFAPVYPPQLVYYQGRNAVVDRLHNLWLDQAVTTGIPGALALASLLVATLALAARTLRRSADMRARLLAAGLLAAFLGHLVDMQFSFEVTASATVFFLLVGLTGALARGLDESDPGARLLPARPIFITAGIVFLGVVALLVVRPLVADVLCRRGQVAAQPAARASAAIAATRLWPAQPEYRLRLALTLADQGEYDAAAQALESARRMRPADPDLAAQLGYLYAQWGGRERDAEAQFRQAVALAPNVATYHVGLGLALAAQGRLEAGIAALELAVALDATYGEAYGLLAQLYGQVGRSEDARRAAEEAERWRAP